MGDGCQRKLALNKLMEEVAWDAASLPLRLLIEVMDVC